MKQLKIFSGLVFSLVIFQAGAATDFASQQGLLNKLNHSPEVPVIVTFNSNAEIQTGQTSRAGRSLAMPLRSRQDALMARMPKTGLKRHKRFEYVPQMAMTVDAQGLQQLLQDPDITVAEDRLHKPVLAKSVPRVYSSHNSSEYSGNNWAVAILDSGVDKSHLFLSGKVVSEACYSDGGGQSGTTSLCPGGATSSVATGSGVDCSSSINGCFHGTFVAGIAVGNGSSFDGVAKAGKIISIQVFSKVNDIDFCDLAPPCLGAYSSDIIDGLERVYALRNQHNIAAVNLSLGSGLYSGTCDNDPAKPVIDMLKGVKIATVVASGNDSSNSKISSPACISSAIAVGASFDNSDNAWGGSNSSSALDLYAPGANIQSSLPGGGYASGNGTSFAAPHVAGAWAVLRQASPGSSVNQIESVLKSKGPWIAKGGISRRRLNVTGALDELVPDTPAGEFDMAPILMLLL